jgi:hypothetical protein
MSYKDISQLDKGQLRQYIAELKRAIEKTEEELAARPEEDVIVYGVPRFEQIRSGVYQDRWYIYRTGPEAYDNAYRIRVTENPLAQFDIARGAVAEDDYTSRYQVKSFYMHKDWKFND